MRHEAEQRRGGCSCLVAGKCVKDWCDTEIVEPIQITCIKPWGPFIFLGDHAVKRMVAPPKYNVTPKKCEH